MRKLLIKLILKCCLSISIFLLLIVAGFLVMRQLAMQSILSEARALNNSGGISEVREVSLGGVNQYIAIEGESLDSPICLFLHGGPGLSLPYGISSRQQLSTVTSSCTAVYWDQRGAGKTYSQNPNEISFSYEELEQDAIELIAYLREEFEQDKIYLIGYSWGTVLGLRLAKKIPDQLIAYFGLSQVIHPAQSEQELYDWLLSDLTEKGSTHLVSTVKRLGPPPYDNSSDNDLFQKLLTHSDAYVKWQEGIPNVNVIRWILQVLSCPDLTPKEAWETLFTASNTTLSSSDYWREIQEVNFLEEIEELTIPVYFAVGVDDYICSKTLLESFVEEIDAKEKDILILTDSAHYYSSDDESLLYNWMKSFISTEVTEVEEESTLVDEIISTILEEG